MESFLYQNVPPPESLPEGTDYSGADPIAPFATYHKILLIEDNPGDVRLVELLLEESDLLNCRIINFGSLSEGMAALETDDDYSAVLLDLTLPDSRGFETLEKLVSRFPEANIIVMTGLADKSLGIKAVKAGAQDFLVKGDFSSDLLAKSLRYSIERNSIRKRLEETQRMAHIGSWEFDPRTRQFSASDEVYRIFGLTPHETVFTYPDLELADCPFHIFKLIQDEVMREHVPIKKDVEIKSGQHHLFMYIECRQNKDTENNLILTGIVQNVTERRQAEELRKARDVAEQSAKMKEQFIASISHEMRTPMNAIYGMSNLLSHTQLTDEQSSYIRSVKQSSEILLGIINDILEISTLQNGKIDFDYKDFDLHELLHNLVNVMQYKKSEKAITFDLQIDPTVPKILNGDKLRLNQILYNLVGNAIKFTDEGVVGIRVENQRATDERVRLKFNIQDTGIGIPEDKLEAIFDTFTRIRHKDRIYEGTGLGLSIVKSLVTQQGGTIGVDSEVGKGSQFFFYLSFGKGSTAPAEAVAESTDFESHLGRPIRLLLVEDHKMNQLVAKKTLERQWGDISVTIANNGQEAVDILREQTFDIILMDLQMPVMDGYETTAYIRKEMPPDIAAIPILAMTAHANISKDEQFKSFGMNDFVLKPFEPKQLFSKIIQYIKKSDGL